MIVAIPSAGKKLKNLAASWSPHYREQYAEHEKRVRDVVDLFGGGTVYPNRRLALKGLKALNFCLPAGALLYKPS